MKRGDVNLSELLKSINLKVDGLTKQVATLTLELNLVKEENAILRQRLAKYEEPDKDSRNSSIPASKENPKAQAIRRTQSLRKKSDRPSGGQPGHKGSTLELSTNPDLIEAHQAHFCMRCGKDISSIEGVVTDIRQSIDIPLPTPIITEHHLISKQCTCGYCSKTEFPKHVPSCVSYGTNLRALVTYLNHVQYIPYERLSSMLEAYFGIKISQGTIYNILQKMKRSTDNAYQAIRRGIESSSVVGADETGENINGQLHWMWVWQTEHLTYIHQDKSRGKIAIDKEFPKGLAKSTLVTDRHSSYFNMQTKGHQLCLAHILRELTYLNELDTKQTWSASLQKLLQEAIHKRKTLKWELIDRNSILERFEDLLATATQHLHKKIQALHKSLIKHKQNIFRFLFDPDIPYDNNASERAIRPLKVKQKVSGCFKSQQGADAFCQMHSISQTAKKNGMECLLSRQLWLLLIIAKAKDGVLSSYKRF